MSIVHDEEREGPERCTPEYYACPSCEEVLDWELDWGGDCCPVCGCDQEIDPSVVPPSQQYAEWRPVQLMSGDVQLMRDA